MTIARLQTIPQISYECFKANQVGYMRRRTMYPPAGHDYGWQALAHPEKEIEGEQVRNLIEAKAHDVE